MTPKKHTIIVAKGRAGDVPEILVYGFIDDTMSAAFSQQVKAWEKVYPLINVRVNSKGGSVYDGIAMFNTVRNAKCAIDMYVDGVAASMASALVLAGRKVYMSKYARIMTHKPSGFAGGSSAELRVAADEIDNCQLTICSMMSERLGIPEADVTSKYLNGKDNYFLAPAALAAGLVDGIYDGEDVALSEDSDVDLVYAQVQTRFEARLESAEVLAFEDVPNNGLNINKNMKQIPLAVWAQVCSQMGITDSVDDAGFVAAMKKVIDKAGKADAIQARLTTAENDLKEVKKQTLTKDVTAMLDAAKTAKKITEKQSTVFATHYAEDPAGLKEVLDSMGAFVSITERLNQNEKPGVFSAQVQAMYEEGWDKLMESGKMTAFKAASPEAYEELYKDRYGFYPNQKPGLKK